jgi:iron complex outermembrane receptor protein
VLWDPHDVMLQDVERIEVISGPGGTLWGTNAVNGVINVVTRSSAQTQGTLVVVNGGNLDAGASFRHGGTLGADGRFRIHAKSSRQESTENAAGLSKPDGWTRTQAGFRADWTGPNGGFMLQGGAMQGKTEHRGFFGPFELRPIETHDAHLLGRWTRRHADGSDTRVQAYLDHSRRDDALLYQPQEDIVDLEFQHGLAARGAHRLLVGGGYRRAHDDIRPGVFFGFVPESRTLSWTNFFAQDEITLSERASLSLGMRLEHNSFTGTEVLPSARWSWQLSEDRLLWAAVSRAVRAPARLDRDIVLPPQPPFIIAGGPDFVSEVAKVYELGYRAQPSSALSFSVTAFYQDWDRLRSGQLPPNAQVQNMIRGHTSGLEGWASWQPAPRWRLSGGVTTLHKNLRVAPGSTDPTGPSALGNDPDYQWTLRSSFDLPRRQEFDIMVRRIDDLPEPDVPAYTAVDLRYGWRVNERVALSVAVRNLLDAAHPEFDAAADRSEIARSMLVQLRWSL